MLLPSVRNPNNTIVLAPKFNFENLTPKPPSRELPRIYKSFERKRNRYSNGRDSSFSNGIRSDHSPTMLRTPLSVKNHSKKFIELANLKERLKRRIETRERKTELSAKLGKQYGIVFDKLSLLKYTEEEMIEKAVKYHKKVTCENASKLIQHTWRKYRVKQNIAFEKLKVRVAARKIQSCWIKYLTQVLIPKKQKMIYNKAAVTIQKNYRGYSVRRKYKLIFQGLKLKRALKYFEDLQRKMNQESAKIILKNWKSYKLRKAIKKKIDDKAAKKRAEKLESLRVNLPLPARKNSDNFREMLKNNQDFDPDAPPERIRSRTRVDHSFQDRRHFFNTQTRSFIVSVQDTIAEV
ncbi:unnamed protein product [Blepharisma stoltei]|uniref:Uncharacterized protein n=1 Tax=Blepharisma stoltei TaxID=1481888 RepID=A0AAU9J5M9_9CILI|nr:unnamed protein product [Blepharisma stoltei]